MNDLSNHLFLFITVNEIVSFRKALEKAEGVTVISEEPNGDSFDFHLEFKHIISAYHFGQWTKEL